MIASAVKNSVGEYFVGSFNRKRVMAPQDMKDMNSMPLNSACGGSCKIVIDAGKKLMDASDPSVHDDIIRATGRACLVYICG